jgi:hypothetical protein
LSLTPRQEALKLLMDVNITVHQHEAVRYMVGGRIDDIGALVAFGASRQRTLASLERKGLVRYYPYGGEDHQGVWGLTPLGRKVAAIEVNP